MPRPLKYTVDYFSHDANASEGKTLTIIFNHFGHEGISAWWQLLERVSSTNNHVICIRNPEDLEYLAAKFHLSPEKLTAILTKLAELEAIDPSLFEYGYIWSQNLINRVTPVYHTRKQSVPLKPKVNDTDNPVYSINNPINIPGYTHTKETKETKLKKDPLISPLKNDGAVFSFYQNEYGLLTEHTTQILNDWINQYTSEWVIDALKEGIKHGAKKIAYVEKILWNWKESGKGTGKPKNKKTQGKLEGKIV
jgi:DnaD/phage-associated family protein